MAKPKKNARAEKNGGATVGYEAELWRMADALRGSMDAAEYKHVVLGLIFLKYIYGPGLGGPAKRLGLVDEPAVRSGPGPRLLEPRLPPGDGLPQHVEGEPRGDGVFVEGWALYTGEMLMRAGLRPEGSAARGQVLRLARYRAARIGVDVNLHTGRWTFDQAVSYFMEAGGLDREAAEGEAAGAASEPTQKITYMVGKWQIMRLLGLYRDRLAKEFRLGAFHDALLANGSLPLSVVEWILLDDPASLDRARQGKVALVTGSTAALRQPPGPGERTRALSALTVP